MVKTITIKLTNTSENVEMIVRDIVKLYREEIKFFSVKDGSKVQKVRNM